MRKEDNKKVKFKRQEREEEDVSRDFKMWTETGKKKEEERRKEDGGGTEKEG